MTVQTSKWEKLRLQANMALIEHIYRTEDTLYQIIFDRRFRPELFRLKVEETRRSDAAKRQSEILDKFKHTPTVIDLDGLSEKSQTRGRNKVSTQAYLREF